MPREELGHQSHLTTAKPSRPPKGVAEVGHNRVEGTPTVRPLPLSLKAVDIMVLNSSFKASPTTRDSLRTTGVGAVQSCLFGSCICHIVLLQANVARGPPNPNIVCMEVQAKESRTGQKGKRMVIAMPCDAPKCRL